MQVKFEDESDEKSLNALFAQIMGQMQSAKSKINTSNDNSIATKNLNTLLNLTADIERDC